MNKPTEHEFGSGDLPLFDNPDEKIEFPAIGKSTNKAPGPEELDNKRKGAGEIPEKDEQL